MNDVLLAADSVPVRTAIQVIVFMMALIAAPMVWREYRRSGGDFLKYLAISFLLFATQMALKLGFFLYATIFETAVPEAVMPMVDHLLKVAAFLFLTHSFSFVCPLSGSAPRIFRGNLLVLVGSAPFIWYGWLRYLEHASVEAQRFPYFWGDLFYETWLVGLLFWGLSVLAISSVRMRRGFVVALSILLAMEIVHLFNVVVSHNTIPDILMFERLLMVPFFYVIIMSIHAEILGDVKWAQRRNEALNEQMYRNTIQALVGALELKDMYMQGHGRRVMEHATAVGKKLGLSEEEMKTLYFGAILHDIGKIATHEDILGKPGELLSEEVAHMRQHARNGAIILEGIETLRPIMPIVTSHHERWDGTGYPESLKGEEIPISARVIAVADAFDAMTSNRSYRKAMSFEEAVKEIREGRGTQFDPAVVDAFLEIIEDSVWWHTHRTTAAHERNSRLSILSSQRREKVKARSR